MLNSYTKALNCALKRVLYLCYCTHCVKALLHCMKVALKPYFLPEHHKSCTRFHQSQLPVPTGHKNVHFCDEKLFVGSYKDVNLKKFVHSNKFSLLGTFSMVKSCKTLNKTFYRFKKRSLLYLLRKTLVMFTKVYTALILKLTP